MRKPKRVKDVTKKLRKKHKYELKRKELRKKQKLQHINTMRVFNNLSEEEQEKILAAEAADEAGGERHDEEH